MNSELVMYITIGFTTLSTLSFVVAAYVVSLKDEIKSLKEKKLTRHISPSDSYQILKTDDKFIVTSVVNGCLMYLSHKNHIYEFEQYKWTLEFDFHCEFTPYGIKGLKRSHKEALSRVTEPKECEEVTPFSLIK